MTKRRQIVKRQRSVKRRLAPDPFSPKALAFRLEELEARIDGIDGVELDLADLAVRVDAVEHAVRQLAAALTALATLRS